MADPRMTGTENEQAGFSLGKPALVCRWRIANRALPLANRHLRALVARTVNDRPVPRELASWAKQHVEGTLAAGSAEHPDGVLMLVVDEEGKAAMTVGPYEPLPRHDLGTLVTRARAAAVEGEETGVPPEVLWLLRDGGLTALIGLDQVLPGSSTLVRDLAGTLGMPVSRDASLLGAGAEALAGREAMLVSDEHGVVVAGDAPSADLVRFVDGYQRLLERTGRRSR